MIEELRDQFYAEGYVVIPSVLSSEECSELREDLKRIVVEEGARRHVGIYKRLFEKSNANLRLFMKEPVVSLAEAIIMDDYICRTEGSFPNNDKTLQCHVIHNNGLVVSPNQEGINTWHQDDPPHFIVKHAMPPCNIHLPVLVLTANYYLNDVTTVDHGPTMVIPKSHLFGRRCPKDLNEKEHEVVHCTAPEGSVVMFNCQLWHRGSKNRSDVTRYVSQVTYARRIIGHKYQPFMNYQMPQHVVDQISTDPRWKRLAGFIDSGPYG
jgi:ectoine hydroxylase-related dioxygenase (phytanoyl-CoA dioxygenase family)